MSFKRRGGSGKINFGKGGKKINNSLRGRGSRFKMLEYSRVLLSDSMNSMVELITSQLATKGGESNSKEAEISLVDSVVIDS